MTCWITVKARGDCPECGQPVMLNGPWASMRCPSCHSTSSVGYYWPKVVAAALEKGAGGRHFAAKFMMDTSKPVTTLHYAVNKDQPPICSSCDAALEGVDAIATGTDGTFHCAACGAAHETFPAPKNLHAGALQVFLGTRSSEQVDEAAPSNAKPVLFACTNCGGNLQINSTTSRILTCGYCDADLFLPQTLWNALHPVKKRCAFWIRMR
jgi:ribosomal protein L37AE/L43A